MSVGTAQGLHEVLWLGKLCVLVALLVVMLHKVLGKVGIKLLHDILVPVFKIDSLARDSQDGCDGEE